ncbi:MAG: TonB-dependent receptor, partial [Candidatus Aminicenantes bacterium]|nr:TonB-dependent receptor [Candidatus Aminicenantes bacterium]
MDKRTLKVLLAVVLSIGLTASVFAQRQTGSLAGTVHDPEGVPLPGATVSVTGPALMGDASFITTETGTFRFPALPPGTYTVKIELPGFATLSTTGVIVNIGKTTALDIKMEMAAIEEEVTVTGVSPVVDVSSSKVAVSYTADLIKNIPIGRDLYDLLSSAPGVVSENVTYRRTASTHGSSVRGNQYAFDGFMMNDPVTSYLASNINFDAFDEVEMELSAHPAEVGQTDGAYINVVTKSGGNRISGLVQAYYTNESLVDTNFNQHQIQSFRSIAPITPSGETAIAPAKTLKDIDTSVQIGGPLLKDKLWFFGAFRYFDWKRHYTGFNDPDTELPVDVTHNEWSAQGKLTFQPSSSHKFTVNYYRTYLKEPYMTLDVSTYTLPEAAAVWDGEHSDVIYGKWNWILDQNTFLDIRVGYINRYFPEGFQDKLGPQFSYGIYGNPHLDLSTSFYFGTARFCEIYNRGRLEFLGSLTRFVDNFLGGSHELKAGFEHERAKGTWETWLPNEPGGRFLTVNYKYMWEDWGAPYGYISAYAVGSKHGDSDELNQMRRFSAYIQDSFTIGQRLTINAGVRWDYSYGIIPEQTNTGNPFWQNILDNADVVWLTKPQPLYFAPKNYPAIKDYMSWNTFSPRVGITYDPFGDGKTALKASYSRYMEMMMIQFTSLPNPNYIHTGDFNWYDLNENNWPDVTDSYEFVWLSREEDAQGLTDVTKEVDPDLTPPRVDEISIGIEREIFNDFSLGVTFIRKWERNMIESFKRPDVETVWTESQWSEPGDDGVFGTADDNTFPVYLGSGDSPTTWSTNIDGTDGKPKAERNYTAVQFTINKRLSNRWQFFGSVVVSKAEGNLG